MQTRCYGRRQLSALYLRASRAYDRVVRARSMESRARVHEGEGREVDPQLYYRRHEVADPRSLLRPPMDGTTDIDKLREDL
jgi:hypothetical protein